MFPGSHRSGSFYSRCPLAIPAIERMFLLLQASSLPGRFSRVFQTVIGSLCNNLVRTGYKQVFAANLSPER